MLYLWSPYPFPYLPWYSIEAQDCNVLSAVPTATDDYSTEIERCSNTRVMLHGWRCLGLNRGNHNNNENSARLEVCAAVSNAVWHDEWSAKSVSIFWRNQLPTSSLLPWRRRQQVAPIKFHQTTRRHIAVECRLKKKSVSATNKEYCLCEWNYFLQIFIFFARIEMFLRVLHTLCVYLHVYIE